MTLHHGSRHQFIARRNVSPELFAAAGCTFEFSEAMVRPLTDMIRGELAKMA